MRKPLWSWDGMLTAVGFCHDEEQEASSNEGEEIGLVAA